VRATYIAFPEAMKRLKVNFLSVEQKIFARYFKFSEAETFFD
jgi:hypothetical protein